MPSTFIYSVSPLPLIPSLHPNTFHLPLSTCTIIPTAPDVPPDISPPSPSPMLQSLSSLNPTMTTICTLYRIFFSQSDIWGFLSYRPVLHLQSYFNPAIVCLKETFLTHHPVLIPNVIFHSLSSCLLYTCPSEDTVIPPFQTTIFAQLLEAFFAAGSIYFFPLLPIHFTVFETTFPTPTTFSHSWWLQLPQYSLGRFHHFFLWPFPGILSLQYWPLLPNSNAPPTLRCTSILLPLSFYTSSSSIILLFHFRYAFIFHCHYPECCLYSHTPNLLTLNFHFFHGGTPLYWSASVEACSLEWLSLQARHSQSLPTLISFKRLSAHLRWTIHHKQLVKLCFLRNILYTCFFSLTTDS